MIDCSKCIHYEVCANRYANDGCEGSCGYYLQDIRPQDDRADVKRRSDLDEFAHWIAKQIFFKEVKDDLFVELTCRKLHELGIVEKRNDEWFYTTADDTD